MKICLSGYWSIKNNCWIIKRASNLYKGLNAGDYLKLYDIMNSINLNLFKRKSKLQGLKTKEYGGKA